MSGADASHQAREGAAGCLFGQLSSVKLQIPIPQRLPLLPMSRVEVADGVHCSSLSPVPLSSLWVERGAQVIAPVRHVGFRLIFVFLGLFGAAFAITGALVALPRPEVGGTCGPGTSSESSIVAFFDPGSIGAHAEPSTAHATDRADWMAFVGECQASADGRCSPS